MIRPFRETDCTALIPLVQADRHMQPDEIRDRMAENTSWVYDDGSLRGCAAVTTVRSTASGKRIDLWLYTAPDQRHQGIGSALWRAVTEQIAGLDVDQICTGYRSDRGEAEEFFVHRGFQPWFASHLLAYDGPAFPEPNLEVHPYHDGLFDHYIRLQNQGFFELRQTNDIRPYECYPEGFEREPVRQRLLTCEEEILFFRLDGQLVAVVHLGRNYIDNLVVAAAYQRQGVGRKIMQFSVNRLRKRGVQQALLGVVDSNHGARALYHSLGFQLIETHSVGRMQKRGQSPFLHDSRYSL